MLEKNKKGFSLFTPLIGTTVIVISILVSTMVLQNNIKISRAITGSFEQYDKELDAQLIKASTSIELINELNTFEKSYLNGSAFASSGIGGNITCSNYNQCKTDLMKNFKANLHTFGRDTLFNTLVNQIETISGYTPQSSYCPMTSAPVGASLCIADAATAATGLFKVTEDGDYLSIKFDVSASSQSELEKIKNSFIVVFVKDYEKIGVSVTPYGFDYVTSSKLNKRFNEMANISSNILKESQGDVTGNCHGMTYSDCLNAHSTEGFNEIKVFKNDATGDIKTCFTFNEGGVVCLESDDTVTYNLKCEQYTYIGPVPGNCFNNIYP